MPETVTKLVATSAAGLRVSICACLRVDCESSSIRDSSKTMLPDGLSMSWNGSILFMSRGGDGRYISGSCYAFRNRTCAGLEF